MSYGQKLTKHQWFGLRGPSSTEPALATVSCWGTKSVPKAVGACITQLTGRGAALGGQWIVGARGTLVLGVILSARGAVVTHRAREGVGVTGVLYTVVPTSALIT